MNNTPDLRQPVRLVIDPECAETETALRLRGLFSSQTESLLLLHLTAEGLLLESEGQTLMGDFSHLLPRLAKHKIGGELLAKAAKLKDTEHPTALDATAGLGEDSLILAAAGFTVDLYERNPVICELLRDALDRAAKIPELTEIVSRMTLHHENSIEAMGRLDTPPDVILLDPMFPERQKSALVKKKLQMIQKLETPCDEEKDILLAAAKASPKKLIVKRPPKGPYLADIKPDYSISGKAVRFDCIVMPVEKLKKYFF